MKSKLKRWGNSLALRIPKPVALEAKLQEGSDVEISVKDGEILIRPGLKKYRLKDLLAEVTDENRHELMDFGPPVGKEIW